MAKFRFSISSTKPSTITNIGTGQTTTLSKSSSGGYSFDFGKPSGGSSVSRSSTPTPTPPKKIESKEPTKEDLKKAYGEFAPSNIIINKDGSRLYTSVRDQKFNTPEKAAAANVRIKAPQAFNPNSSVYKTKEAGLARQFVTEVKTGKPQGYYFDPKTGQSQSYLAGSAPGDAIFIGRPGSVDSFKEVQAREKELQQGFKDSKIQDQRQYLDVSNFIKPKTNDLSQTTKDKIITAAILESKPRLSSVSPDTKNIVGGKQKALFEDLITSSKVKQEVIGLEQSEFQAQQEAGAFFDVGKNIKNVEQLKRQQKINVQAKSGQDFFDKLLLEQKIDSFNKKYENKELTPEELKQVEVEEKALQKEIKKFEDSFKKREEFEKKIEEASPELKLAFGMKSQTDKFAATPAQKFFTVNPNEFFGNLVGLSGVYQQQQEVIGTEPVNAFFDTEFTKNISPVLSQKKVVKNIFEDVDVEKTINKPQNFADLERFRQEVGFRVGKIQATRPLTETEQFQDLLDIGVSTGVGAGVGLAGGPPGVVIGGLAGLTGGLVGVGTKERVRRETGSFELGASAGLAADIVTDIGVGAAGFKLFEFATEPIIKSSKFVGTEKVFSIDPDNFVLTTKGVRTTKTTNRFKEFFGVDVKPKSDFIESAFDVSKKTTIKRKVLDIESLGLKDLDIGQEFQVYKQFSRGQGVPRVLKGNLEGLESLLPETRFEDLLRTKFDVASGLKSADTFDIKGFVTTTKKGVSDTKIVKNIQSISGRKAPRVGVAPLGFEDTKINLSSRLTGFGDEVGDGISKGGVRGKFKIIDEDISGGFTKQFKQGVSEAKIVKGELVTDASKKSVFDFGRVKVLPKDYGKGLYGLSDVVESKSGVSKTLLKTSKKTSAKKSSKSVSKTLGQTRFDTGRIISSVADEGTEQVLNFGKFASGFVIYPGVKSISKTITGTRDFFRIKGVEDFKTNIKTGLGLDEKVLSLEDIGIKEETGVSTGEVIETRPVTSSASITGLKSDTRVKTDVKVKIDTKLDTKLKTDFLFKLGDLNIPKPKIPIPPPIFLPNFDEIKSFKGGKKKKLPAYSVYVRRSVNPKQGIKKVLIDKGLPKNLALTKGLRTADNYTDRTVILKQKGTTTRRDIPKPSFLLKKFREPKSKKLKSKGRLVFVEKSKHAIDSVNEKLGIPYKAQKQRRKKKLIGKLNIKL